MKRRTFLQASLALTALSLMPAWAAPAAPRKLVLIHLFGGNDGLNTVVSLGKRYQKLRPHLALGAGETLELKQGLRLHRALEPLMPLWSAGKLAIVNGVGYPEPNRSHFVSSDIWHTAHLRPAGDGWLGKLKLPGVNVDDTLSRAFWGTDALSLKAPDKFQLSSSHADLLRELYAGDPTFERLEHALQCARCPGETIEAGDFGKQLSAILRLWPQGRIFHTTLGGFDTHGGQRDKHARVLAELGRGLAGFWQALRRRGWHRDTLVMVYSEFGRRVEENASGGTDHGTAGPLFLLGERVRGGFHGEVPSLDNLQEGDLIHTVDFRSVYSTVLSGWLELDPKLILGGTFPRLGLL